MVEYEAEILESKEIQVQDFKDLGDLMMEEKNVRVDIPTKDSLNIETGTYTREIFIPAGTMLLGYKHNTSCLNIMTKGSLLVKGSFEENSTMLVVPENESLTFWSPKGTQKIGYAIEDTIFINVFTNVKSKTVKEALEELIVIDSCSNEMGYDDALKNLLEKV